MMDFSPLKDCRYAVIGDPIDHSLSPQMQNAAFEYHDLGRPYGRLHVTQENLPEFFEYARHHLRGVNITIPLKEKAATLVDEIDDSARFCNSVNTLVIDNGRIKGFSTDGIGLKNAIKESFSLDCRDKTFLLIGAGGAAVAAAFALADDRAKAVFIVNRSVKKARILAEKISAFRPEIQVRYASTADQESFESFFDQSDILLHSTALGWHDGDPSPVKLPENPANKPLLFDLVYRDNALQQQAREIGMKTADGSSMLVYQGAASFELWTGLPAPVEIMKQALRSK